MDSTAIVPYHQTEAELVAAAEQAKGLTIGGVEDRKGYALVHSTRVRLKGYRTAIEAQRKELKADALEWGRRVDAEAKRLTAIVEPAERELEAQQERIDAERERIKAEAEAAARAKLDGRVAALTVLGHVVTVSAIADLSDEEYEAVLATAQAEHAARQERERKLAQEMAEAQAAHEARLAEVRRQEEEARRVEAARLGAERAQLERQRAELAAQQKAERERLAQEAARVAAERAEAQAKLDAERAAFEAERAAAEAAKAPKVEPIPEPLMFTEASDEAPIADAQGAAILTEHEQAVVAALEWAYAPPPEEASVRAEIGSGGKPDATSYACGFLDGMRAERARMAGGS